MKKKDMKEGGRENGGRKEARSQKYFKNDLTVCVFLLTASCDVASEQTIQQLPQKRTEGT